MTDRYVRQSIPNRTDLDAMLSVTYTFSDPNANKGTFILTPWDRVRKICLEEEAIQLSNHYWTTFLVLDTYMVFDSKHYMNEYQQSRPCFPRVCNCHAISDPIREIRSLSPRHSYPTHEQNDLQQASPLCCVV
jgi:hypothetical protein